MALRAASGAVQVSRVKGERVTPCRLIPVAASDSKILLELFPAAHRSLQGESVQHRGALSAIDTDENIAYIQSAVAGELSDR